MTNKNIGILVANAIALATSLFLVYNAWTPFYSAINYGRYPGYLGSNGPLVNLNPCSNCTGVNIETAYINFFAQIAIVIAICITDVLVTAVLSKKLNIHTKQATG